MDAEKVGAWQCGAAWPFGETAPRAPLSVLELALAKAVKDLDAKGMKRMVDSGAALASLSILDGTDDSAMAFAVSSGHVAFAKELLPAGIRADEPRGPGQSQYTSIAIWADQADMLSLLIEAGAALVAGEGHMTSMMFAARDGSIACMRLLAQMDAGSVDEPGQEGSTPLMIAAKNGRGECVAALLGWGADPKVRDREGHCAMDWAVGEAIAPLSALADAEDLRHSVRIAPAGARGKGL